MTLWTVLSRDDQPSLWNGMMMLVLGRRSEYSFSLQLDTHTQGQRSTRGRQPIRDKFQLCEQSWRRPDLGPGSGS